MGKGFNNYMCKKFFHPASRDNLKRVWMAEQRTEAEKKKQDDLRQQYEREQETFNNKALLSKESKEKLSLNFMYEPPPGSRREEQKDQDGEGDGKTEYKFEWQRTWGTAPRESWAKGDEAIKDQPFGIQVRNVRCVKCHKYGHINTDKECPLYGKALDSETPVGTLNQEKLIEEMKEDGMKMRFGAWDLLDDPRIKKYDMLQEPEKRSKKDDPEKALANMSKEEKLKLLAKLRKMEKKSKKKSKKSKKSKKKSSDSDSDSEDERTKRNKRKERKRRDSRSESERRRRRDSDNESERERSHRREKERKRRDRHSSESSSASSRRRKRR